MRLSLKLNVTLYIINCVTEVTWYVSVYIHSLDSLVGSNSGLIEFRWRSLRDGRGMKSRIGVPGGCIGDASRDPKIEDYSASSSVFTLLLSQLLSNCRLPIHLMMSPATLQRGRNFINEIPQVTTIRLMRDLTAYSHIRPSHETCTHAS